MINKEITSDPDTITNKEICAILEGAGYKHKTAIWLLCTLKKKYPLIYIGGKTFNRDNFTKIWNEYQQTSRASFDNMIDNKNDSDSNDREEKTKENGSFITLLHPVVKEVLSHNAKKKNMSLDQFIAKMLNDNIMSKIEI
jgi:predicted HicB family RNase H-like nuclease